MPSANVLCKKAANKFKLFSDTSTYSVIDIDIRTLMKNIYIYMYSYLLTDGSNHSNHISEKKDYHCTICQKDFTEKKNLQMHINSLHKGTCISSFSSLCDVLLPDIVLFLCTRNG